jgi:predicted  nucleic acid-binding Zn-ribbon protein
MKKSICIFVFLLFSALPLQASYAVPPADEVEYQEKVKDLKSLLESINHTSARIESIQRVLKSPEAVGRERELRSQIDKLSEKLKTLEESFTKSCTDVEFVEFETEKDRALEWDQEFKELLGPVMREVKRMTALPREIEELRSDIETYESELEVARKASNNLLALLAHVGTPQLTQKLNSIIRVWQHREQEISTQMNIAAQQLEQKLDERKPLLGAFQDVFRTLIKGRGRNLLVALLALVLTWLILRFVYKLIRRSSPFRNKDRSIYLRLFDVVYIIFTVAFSLLALLGVLYSLGDWVLLSLAIIFLLGIGWASKQAIPRFWRQATLMLNFGAVREGEIVIYNGLPYEVGPISIYTELVNRHLEGGFIRIHLKQLVDLRSRPISENEPLFPSKCGNWVKLSDETYGKVVVQTPEIVELELKGGAFKTYRTVDYLAQSPTNLSSGFRIWITFGLDYSHQAVITQDIPGKLHWTWPFWLTSMATHNPNTNTSIE